MNGKCHEGETFNKMSHRSLETYAVATKMKLQMALINTNNNAVYSYNAFFFFK